MGKGREDLFHLIQSMSKSEKRYFKMESKKAGNKTSNHVKLFDAINNLEEYDEEVLKKKLRKEKFIQHLSAEKRYLYQAVLRSIRNFRGDQSIFAQIKTMVVDANYLLERALYDQAENILDKAQKLAEKIDDTVSLLEINVKRQLLSTAHKKKEHRQDIYRLMKEKDEIVELLLKKLELRDLLNKTGVANRENDNAQMSQYIKEKKSLLEQTKNLPSFYALLWNYGITDLHYTELGELEKRSDIRSKIIELWNQHPDIKNEFFYQYLNDLTNVASKFTQKHKTKKFFEYLNILENEKPRNSFDRVFIFKHVVIKKLFHFMTIGDFKKAQLLIPEIESKLKIYNIDQSSIITIRSNIAVLYFCIEDFHSCLSWVNKNITLSKSKIRLDLQKFNRLLAIIAYIETQKSFDFIDNFCRATHRFIVKSDSKEHNHVPLTMLDYIQKYLNSTEDQQKEVLIEFKMMLETFQTHPTKKLTSGLEEFHFWIRSKLEKRPIAQLIKESNSSSN